MASKTGLLSTTAALAFGALNTTAKPADAQVYVGINPGYVPYSQLAFDPYCPGEVGVVVPTFEGPVVECEAPRFGLGFGFGLGPLFRDYAYGRGFGRGGFDRFYDRRFENHGGSGHGGGHDRGFGGRDGGHGFGDGGRHQPGFEQPHGGRPQEAPRNDFNRSRPQEGGNYGVQMHQKGGTTGGFHGPAPQQQPQRQFGGGGAQGHPAQAPHGHR